MTVVILLTKAELDMVTDALDLMRDLEWLRPERQESVDAVLYHLEQAEAAAQT